MRFAGAKKQIQFDGFRPSGRGGESIGAAAGMSTMGKAYRSFRGNSFKGGKVAAQGVLGKAQVTNAVNRSNAAVKIAKNDAKAIMAQAEAKKKYYDAQGSAAKSKGIMSGIAGVATAAIGLFSDESTKNTVENIENSLTLLRNLRPVSFYYNEEYSSEPNRKHYGFIAQEYQQHMPDATYRDAETGKLCIETHELIALLVNAVQTLESRLTRLEVKQALKPVVSGASR